MADSSEYYSVIARAISGLPSKTDEARQAIYERARAVLQERLRTLDPPISETELAVERSALELAIQRLESEWRFSDRRQFVRSVRDRLNRSITVRGDSLKAAISAGLAFFQRTQLTAKNVGPRIFNIFREGRWIKHPQIRIAVGLIMAALVAIILYSMTAKNNREAEYHSVTSPSELAFSDATLTHTLGKWEIKGVIKNNSPRTVTGFWLKVTVRDCPNDSPCATIGEEIRHIVMNIPPSQTRIFDKGDLFSSEMLIPKELKWSYEIVQTDAK